MDKSTVILGDFNTPLSTIGRTASQKIRKQLELNTLSINRVLTNIYRICHPTTAKYTFFSSIHRIYVMIDHILDHNTYIINVKLKLYMSMRSLTTMKSNKSIT